MNQISEATVKLFTLVTILLFLVGMISAENLTMNGTITMNETEIEEAICEEQLDILLEEYNSLLEDWRAGENCGIASAMIKDMNEKLSKERDSCREEIGEIKVYRGGFYVLLGVLFITAMIILFGAVKKEQ